MNIFNRSDATYPLNSSTATENPEGSSFHSKTAYHTFLGCYKWVFGQKDIGKNHVTFLGFAIKMV